MREFTVAVPDEVLDDLRVRLQRTRLPNAIDGIGWDQGTELGYLGELLAYWRDSYNWRATEARLNAYEQLLFDVDGQQIHVLIARSSNPNALPLVITHGWPGSILEFLDVLEPLTADFHVITPSLPGFTFSGPTSERGWHPRRIAGAWARILAELGYERYGLQGGDWGSIVSANLADLEPDRVVGLHLNMVTGTRSIPDDQLTEQERASRERSRAWRKTGAGYQEIQGTRPQSLGYGLEDSPAGLAGWIVEKFREWSHGDLREAYTFDRLLDNITAYWVTRTATSSCRIYWEMRQASRDTHPAVPIARILVPTAIAQFPGELSYPPRAAIELAYNVVRWSAPARGGHFAAMEAPEDYVRDVSEFFGSLTR